MDKKTVLENSILAAFAAAFVDQSPTADKTLANSLAMAIHTYLTQVKVDTVITGTALGGVNSATPLNAGPIVTPATVTGTGVGKLS